MESEEQEDETNLQEEEDDVVYDSPPHPPPSRVLNACIESPDTTGTTTSGGGGEMFRYRECRKNQALAIGGHAVDGCREFLPEGSEGTINALKCAACGCHRNFHRKESPPNFYHHHAPLQQPPHTQGYYRLPAPVSYQPPPSQATFLHLALPAPRSEDRMETSSGGGSRKRFRTRFTAEQKARMLGLAERIGWRIRRDNDEMVQRFCQETGISRQVLQVWLHNNKRTLGMSPSPLQHHQNPPTQSSFQRDQGQT